VLADGRWAGGVVLRATADGKGYLRVHLRNGGGKSSTKRVHVLVAEAFHGRRPAGKQILHRNDDKSRNGAADLRYGTRRQNDQDRKRRRRKRERGERQGGKNNGNNIGNSSVYRELPVAAPVAPPVTSGDAP
jgi:hypothetical protein